MQQTVFSVKLFLDAITELSGYRESMKIREMRYLSDGGYYLCPRCRITLDRDFQNYCDRCGQHLDCTGYKKAKILFPDNKN